MKKYFVMLFLMILTMTLVGCSEIANPEDYTIDKEVEIVETITFDQAKDEVPDEEPESNYITNGKKPITAITPPIIPSTKIEPQISSSPVGAINPLTHVLNASNHSVNRSASHTPGPT